MTTPWDAITPQQESDALSSVTQMLTGSQMLKDEPGVVYALTAQKAHPADAGAIDQFMQGLDAEKQVRIAEAAGTKITLSPEQKVLLDGLNVDYSNVDFTQSNAIGDTAAALPPGMQIKKDANGNPVLDANGNVQSEAIPKPYKAKGFGRLFHTLNNDVVKPATRDVVKPATNALNAGWNAVDQTVGREAQHVLGAVKDLGVVGDLFGGANGLLAIQGVKQIWDAANGKSTGPIKPNLSAATSQIEQGAQGVVNQEPDQIAQMKTDGYDPSNIFSVLAFRAKGKETGDTSGLASGWDKQNPAGLFGMNGQQAVGEAEQFLTNPGAFRKGIEADATLTPEQVAAKLKNLSSPQFSDLVKAVSSKRSSFGNSMATDLGIDPVKDSNEFALASGAIDLAASYALDPTILAGKAAKIAKLSQIGIDTISDSRQAVRGLAEAADAAKPLTREELASSATRGPGAVLAKAADIHQAPGIGGAISRVLNPSANAVARGWQRAIDLGDQIREANVTGDRAKEAALTAQFSNELPALTPALPDIIGHNALKGWTEAGGKAVAITGKTEGIRSLDDAVDYLANKVGMIRIMNGRAALQSSLMPGALSAFGLRKLRGLGASWMTERSAERQINAEQEVLTAAKADPALARKLIDDGTLARMEAQADDAVNVFTGEAIQTAPATASSGLKSAERGQGELALTAQGKGDLVHNLRATGSPLGRNSLGWLSPSAIAARTRLGAQRLSTMIPRSLELDIEDPRSSEAIYRLGMTYLNRGDSRMLQAAYNAGSGGERKAIIDGLLDQVGHAAGLSKTVSGQKLLDAAKVQSQSYSSVGDELTLDGENLALHAGQVRTKWTVPSFRNIQQASRRLGLWESTMGRALTSNTVDKLMGQWKLGALFKPSTWTRNMLEGWLKMSLDGNLGDAVKARALLTVKNKELWDKGFANESKEAFDEAMAAGDHAEAARIAKASTLAGDKLGRAKMTNAMANFVPFALAGKAWREMSGASIGEDDLQALESLHRTGGLAAALDGFHQSILEDAMGTRHAALDSTQIAKLGYGPALIRKAIQRSAEQAAKSRSAEGQVVEYTDQVTDGTVGASRYVNAMAMRVNATPGVAKAVLDRLEDPTTYNIDHVVKALDDPAIRAKMGLTAFGKVYWEDANAAARKARTPEEVELGKQEFAQKVINDYAYLLTGRNGKYQDALAKEIRQTGKAPDEGWVSKNLTNDNRPHSVSAPEVMAMPNGGAKSIPTMLQDLEGGAFEWMVERPLLRTTSSPAFLVHYTKSYKQMRPAVDALVDHFGISREAAENLASETSVRNAWVKMESQIDDPGQKTQFDIIARNMFPFSRATQAMIRRWGGSLWRDPVKARKMMLAYEGAVHTGLVYKNAYGEPTFTYPGSGIMNFAMRQLANIPGFGGFANFPMAGTMTGQVLMSVPGADNPMRMSMGPMISIPMREIFNLFPDHRAMLDEVDSAINGPIGVGQTWSQLVPNVAKKFYGAMDDDQRNSALASSTVGALANLYAAGYFPPAGAPPAQIDAFIQRVKAQTRNQLVIRALFGLVAPAAPTSPTEGTSASQADYAFRVSGIGQMADEYKSILNDVGGDTARANAIFIAMHPDMLAYEVPHTQATTSKTSLPATAAALNWMSTNAGFIKKYKSVAAYFLPMESGSDPFSEQAYQTQLELGLRQRKTPDEFYSDLRVRDAENVFYPAVDQFNAQIAEAKANGDSGAVTQITAQKSAWETQFKAMNPLFGQKIDSYPDARATAGGQLADLRQMLQDGQVPQGLDSGLSNLLQAYDGLVAYQQSHKGSTTMDTQARSQALAIFNDWVQSNVAGGPLESVYDGVFRVLNTNLVNLAPTTTGS